MAKKSTSKLFEDETKTELTEQEMNAPVEDDIQDIDLSIINKKRFRINGDNSKILELNVSDMRIATRLKEAYPRLNDYMDSIADKFSTIPDDDTEITEEELEKLGDIIDEIDNKMRDELNYIFDAPVSEICGADGSMWDPIDGSFRYEHIIDKLTKLYENNLDKEFMNMKRRVETKTGKYVKLQDHKRKQK